MINLKDIEPDATFLAQLTVPDDGPVTLINTFAAPPGQVEAVIDVRRQESEIMTQPGFISAQLHQGVDGSHVLADVAVRESTSALRTAFHDPRFQALLPLHPDGSVSYPVLTRTTAVPGICVAFRAVEVRAAQDAGHRAVIHERQSGLVDPDRSFSVFTVQQTII
ncbi:antibiotic biosynthesis monooxygenase family protein [Streptomyces sp. NPDC059479]|uniref:antibiotic biosynthesis monooxygenase family protein n=1 Tax=Streptomyces sp. NPDC059479 TaxID=3346848 RepID=UPI0036988B74